MVYSVKMHPSFDGSQSSSLTRYQNIKISFADVLLDVKDQLDFNYLTLKFKSCHHTTMHLPSFSKLLLASAFYSWVIGRARPPIGSTLNGSNFLRVLSSVDDSYPFSINSLGPSRLFQFFFTVAASNSMT